MGGFILSNDYFFWQLYQGQPEGWCILPGLTSFQKQHIIAPLRTALELTWLAPHSHSVDTVKFCQNHLKGITQWAVWCHKQNKTQCHTATGGQILYD